MDALAQGYGSDSSSDGSTENKTQALGLLANYSDNSSSDEDADETAMKNRPLVIGTAIIETKESTSMQQGNDSSSPMKHGSKKRKLSETQTEKNQNGLPSPPLLSSSAVSSSRDNLILFSKNYLTNKLQYKTANTENQLQEKLEQMHQHQSTGTNKSFAEQLKLQKDFGNPHMFPSVIEHFGIDPLESNSSILKVKFQGFEFIDRLMVKEEENRIREAQNT